jgi:uncharacterized protein YjlB
MSEAYQRDADTAAGPAEERFADDGTFPNSRLPLLIYASAIDATSASPEAMEKLFAKNGWPPQWRASVFTYHHYHSTAHECLGVAVGEATLQLGGPQGRQFHIKAGDVVVIPAGVAHKRITASEDFLVVGAYPPGEEKWDILRGNPGDRPKADHAIARLPIPERDPVQGRDGALLRAWR